MQLLEDDHYAGVAKKVIGFARRYVRVSQFKIDSAGIKGSGVVAGLLGALVKKRNEGVSVDVLLNCIEPLRGCSANNASVAWWLQEHNISVRFLPRNRCQHSKVLLVDGEHGVVGSHNWGTNSLLRNRECSLYFTSAAVVSRLEQSFCRSFDEARPFSKKRKSTTTLSSSFL